MLLLFCRIYFHSNFVLDPVSHQILRVGRTDPLLRTVAFKPTFTEISKADKINILKGKCRCVDVGSGEKGDGKGGAGGAPRR